MSKQFIHLFDEWSSSYDQTVAGGDVEYKEVFRSYETILKTVAQKSMGHVIEFGVGTGNLTKELIVAGHKALGIEPSEKMREIAKRKLPGIKIIDGSFLEFPQHAHVDTFVSSYAFHHLTDGEKEKAIKLYSSLLNKGGKIVFADTVFTNEQTKKKAYTDALNKGYNRLANDLNTEFYTTIPILRGFMEKNNFTVTFEQINDFVWIIEAIKGAE